MSRPGEVRPELITTADGSHSLRSDRFAVAYHSLHGAIQESRHVFITAGAAAWLAEQAGPLRVIELGFGTGLNALLLRELARLHPARKFHYHAVEAYPLAPERAAELNYPALLGVETDRLEELHLAPWEKAVPLDPNFFLDKRRADFLEDLSYWPAASMDVFFYDAFAPGSQPELWTPEALARAYALLAPGGLLVTYCAKGQFKRDLKAAGFTVEALPGPPGKREMTRARKA